MQGIFTNNHEMVTAFRVTLSEPRLSRYLKKTNGNIVQAIELYYWNAKLAQSFYITLQMWEISLRNKINEFFVWKYGPGWPFDKVRFHRQLKSHDLRKVIDAIDRQAQSRGSSSVSTGSVVADLSAGFWVSMLSASYGIPFGWDKNLNRIFPREPNLSRHAASSICNDILDLRNRVAHHEPILDLPIDVLRDDVIRMLNAMCPAAHAYGSAACTFQVIWDTRP